MSRFSRSHGRILLSADTDFGTLLALNAAASPSVILFRRTTDRRPARQVALLLSALPDLGGPLLVGSVIVISRAQ